MIPQQDPREPSTTEASGSSTPTAPSTSASNTGLFPIEEERAAIKSRRRHSQSKMSGIKRKVQNYLGVEESSPSSVHALDWFKSHKGDMKTDVSSFLVDCDR